MPTDPAVRRAAFRRLHEGGCFVMPNPWDVGSARFLQHLGFPALATTSAGMAFSLGFPDGGVPRTGVLEHVRAIAGAVEVPVNADFESGFAVDAAGVAESVRLCVATGVAGLSIEDFTGDRTAPLFDLDVAVERIRAARVAIDASGTGVVLTARAECHLVGHPDPLRESIRRLEAYAAAGADCLYAPGLRTPQEVAAVVKAVAPRPVNVLAGGSGFSVAQLRDLGVRRISVGAALARAAWGAFLRAAEEIAGTWDLPGPGGGGALPPAERLLHRGRGPGDGTHPTVCRPAAIPFTVSRSASRARCRAASGTARVRASSSICKCESASTYGLRRSAARPTAGQGDMSPGSPVTWRMAPTVRACSARMRSKTTRSPGAARAA